MRAKRITTTCSQREKEENNKYVGKQKRRGRDTVSVVDNHTSCFGTVYRYIRICITRFPFGGDEWESAAAVLLQYVYK